MRTTQSARLFARARRILPGGVDSPVRAFTSVGASPLFIRSARGAHLDDVDGNRFVDYVMSWGPLIHGHAPAGLVKALSTAARRGTSYGAPCLLEVELAERVRRLMPSLERVRFVSSGTEATMSAVRVARAATKREKIDQIRGVLSRPRRRVSRTGGVGCADTRRADESRRHPGVGGRHAPGELQRPELGASCLRRQPRSDRRAHHRADRRQHGRGAAGRWIPPRAARRLHGSRHASDLRRGHFRLPRGARRSAVARRRHAGSHVPGENHRGRIAGRRIWRPGGPDAPGVAGRSGVSGRNAVGKSAGDDRGHLVSRQAEAAAVSPISRRSGGVLHMD